MSNQTERRVEDLLSRSKLSTNDSASSSNVSMRQSLPSTSSSVVERPADIDKEKFSSQLRDLQNSRKVLSINATPSPPRPLTIYTIYEHSFRDPTIYVFFQMTPSARLMQSFREKLPAFNMREGFLKAVAANQASLFYFLVYPLHVLSGKSMVALEVNIFHGMPCYFPLLLLSFPFCRKLSCE